MHLPDALLLAVGLPAALLLLGIVIMAIVNTARGPRPGNAAEPAGAAPTSTTPRTGLETATLLRNVPVWVGGASLALSGFFLVKYSVEQGWLTANVRLLLGFLLGLLLISLASYVRLKEMSNALRIAQALAGSGIACLYATVYAASGIYETVPASTGFLGLAVTTAAAVTLSLRYGLGVAVIGLLAGFLMPAFVPLPEPKALNLFAYLLLVTCGLFAVAQRRDWWAMGVLALFSGISWMVMWGVGPFFHPGDAGALSLYLIGSFAVVAFFVPAGFKRPEWSDTAAYLSWITVAPLMTFITVRSGYAVEEWQLFAALGFCACLAARFRPLQYTYAPWACLALGVTALSLWSREVPGIENLAAALLAMAAGFGTGSAMLVFLQPSLQRAGLLATVVFTLYALGYFLIGDNAGALLSLKADAVPHVWSGIALALAVLFGALAIPKGRDIVHQHIGSVFAATCAGFIAAAIGVEANTDTFAPALAVEVFLAATLLGKESPRDLRLVVGALFGLFVLRESFALIQSGLMPLLNFAAPGMGPAPLLTYGVPALLLSRSAWLVQRQRDGMLPWLMETAVTVLTACFIFFGMCHLFGNCHTQFTQGVFVTGLFFAAGCVIVFAGRRLSRDAYVWSGAGLFFLALFRATALDLTLRNPLFTGENVGETFFLNGLLLAYAMPLLWLWLGRRPQINIPVPAGASGVLSSLFALAFVSLNVRQYFHGGVLRGGLTGNGEIYAYSAIWLILGAILLGVGTKIKDKSLRIASLLITLFTIGKVFLYDAGALDGLYRVFSFMGLGISMLALSWFYARFIFARKQEN